MARQHVKKHLGQLDKHHKQVRRKLWAMYKKVLRHKKCWKPHKGRKRKKGGMLVSGMGISKGKKGKKGKKAGVLVSGLGLKLGKSKSTWAPKGKKGGSMRSSMTAAQKFRQSARGKALLAQTQPPKTFPKPPAGLHKKAQGFGSMLKSAASSLSKTYNKHKDTINKIGSAIGNTALQLGTQYISGKIEQGKQQAQAQLDRFQNTTAQMMQKAQGHYDNAMAYGQNMYNQGMGMAQGYVNQGVGMAQGYANQGMQMAQGYGNQAQQMMHQAARRYG